MRGPGIIASALAMALSLAACGNGKSADKRAGDPAPGQKSDQAMDTGELGKLFAGDAPAMPAPVAALTFDMSRAEAEQAVPELAKHGLWREPLGLEGVFIRAVFFEDSGTLRYVQVEMPAAGRTVLSRLWGKPVSAKASSVKQGQFWQNPEAGIQAVLEDSRGGKVRLGLWPYAPWRDLLGSEKTTLGFETTPLLGMSAEQVMTEYAHLHPRRVSDRRIDLRVRGYEFNYTHTPVVLNLEDGAVTQVYIKLHYGNYPAMKADMEAAFAAKFGEPAQTGGAYTIWSNAQPLIQMDHSEAAAQFAFWFKNPGASEAAGSPGIQGTPTAPASPAPAVTSPGSDRSTRD